MPLLPIISLLLSIASLGSCSSCYYKPSANATGCNFPKADPSKPYLYDLNMLSQVPVATTCRSNNATNDLLCARGYIDKIDEQIAFLYARRLGYAAVAGLAKYKQGTPLNDPTRNQAIAEGMAERVRKYGGGDGEAGRVMGGEACQIFASLEFEKEQIRETCDLGFDEKIERVCN
jgi:chorismate mutase